jgi:NADH:ubiquinone oxidoreductase subunit 5 (subunit L)/multisubunit Na+/H+ antiporter MnhA subunit
LGGLARAMPLTFATCLVGALAISGIPPLNGFFSKWMIYQAVIESSRQGNYMWIVLLATAMFGSALTLASFVKILHAVFLCKPSAELAGRDLREVGAAMWLPGIGLASLCVLFGVLALQWPLATMIFPAAGAGVQFCGDWSAGPATVLLLAACAAGGLIYLLSTVRAARTCSTYIGGEILSEAAPRSVPGGPPENVEVTGVDFYRTIQDLPPLRGLYAAAERKLFDLYDVGGRAVFFGVEMLRKAHNGLLPMYLTWVLGGLLLLLWLLFFGGRISI